MPISLLLHVDIPAALRPAFEQAGFRLCPALRENEHSPILPADGAFDPSSINAVLTIGSIGLSEAHMAALPNLRLICCQGVGYEKVDLDAARARGIMVANGAGTNDTAVADHALALLAAMVRDIPGLDRAVRRGEWQQARQTRPQLTGRRVGILGLGNIGLKIAKRCAQGFDMEVAYHNRQPRADSELRYCDTVDALAHWADFLVVCTPGGAGTRHLVNARTLEALGADGFLINVSRGSVVDTGALIDCLRRRAIAGAALDVVEGEPEVPAALTALDNIILTPHVAARSPEALEAMFARVLDSLTCYFSGRPVPAPVPGMASSTAA
ncbi:2-hydroxyacid dehydrogenase [Acerihabitans arboris]|uniref:2-hydroxyacid dehydrogenase n=1 Tax=Acerihabitans arboris TaxID=2691583 RepID=A0A845SDA5_9GAMM|nr:2-hydroxyacid dehydrogenase [Acerihabitans arboris]NDL61879.1 2-hydroxyacid dehydrogenase [Acerihabitans arboris]